ncbi:hypothetical protein [Rickettsia endosymbiont of Halotydeus destructor]|uniref:hypothetical protein n=1 Tax=Rickettsia endosymbiont of Halotydeus destructor TaxID=2996754 RepID=UPI003BB087B0
MLKKYYLAFLLLIFSCNIQASVWGSIGTCLTDPCNCGLSDRTEVWNSNTTNAVSKTFKPGSLCPPWNKSDGRDEDTCLLQFDYPGRFAPFYLQRCAEATSDSSYFTPKIRIRIQSCNAAACWAQSANLNWDGGCVVWPTGYGLPLTRVCARIAIPEIPAAPGLNADPAPGDPGYTAGKHLNEVGAEENDDPIIGVDGQVITLQSPKLCAYSDPGLVNLISDSGAHIDALDWNPNSQPLHFTTELSPVIKALEFVVDKVQGSSVPNLLAKLLGMIGSDNEFFKVLQKIFETIGKIFNFFPSLMMSVVKQFGTLNRSVDSFNFGCINLPLGPFPPPFCPSLGQLTVNPLLHNICYQKNSDGTFNQSSIIAPCVVSKLPNNVVNNAVRVSFNNLIPLCTGDTPDLTTCVKLDGVFSSAEGIHAATSNTDLVKKCDVATKGALCIKTDIPLSCSVKENGCDEGFRIVYSQKMGSRSTPNDYYISDLPDCNTANPDNSATCQEIWGVNIGEFVDVSVNFPLVQDQNSLPIQQTFSLKDNNKDNNKARNFYAQIVNTTLSKVTDTNIPKQDPKNICVFESANLVDCQKRVDSGYNLAVYTCESNHAGISCSNNSYFTPQFIASIQVKDDKGDLKETNSVVTPLSFAGDPSSSSTATENVITLAGYNFSSSVAYIPAIPPKDPADQYIAMPFSGARSLNQLTIYGKYKNNAKPYDKNLIPNPNAVYLKYLEYINGKYIQGGTHACLMPKDFLHCAPLPPPAPPADPTGAPIPVAPQTNQVNCVLAKLTGTNKVDCKKFKDIASTKYLNLGMCQDTPSQCASDNSSVPGITIYTCGATGATTNCYINNDRSDNPVCVLSQDYQERINPSANLGAVLNDSQYYTVKYEPTTDNTIPPNYLAPDDTGKDQPYTLDKADVRDKTFQELNLCVPIPMLTCSAITTPSNDSGNATWLKTDVGDIATGTCKDDWIPIDPTKPLERYCLLNFDAKNANFEKLDPGVGCKEFAGIDIKQDNSQFVDVPAGKYDSKSKIGNFSIVNSYSLTQGTHGGNGKVFTTNISVEVDTNILRNIEYIKIKEVEYDDWLLITVNNQKAFVGPSNFDINKCKNNNLNDQGKSTKYEDIDILSLLKPNQKNIISFQLCCVGGGGLYYNIEYKMKW